MAYWPFFSIISEPSIVHNFKKKGFEERRKESMKIMAKYPQSIPCICEKSNDTNINIENKKFLVPKDMQFAQFICIIRNKAKLKPEQAVFLFINKGMIPNGISTFSELYTQYKDNDGFLYITYTDEKTFG